MRFRTASGLSPISLDKSFTFQTLSPLSLTVFIISVAVRLGNLLNPFVLCSIFVIFQIGFTSFANNDDYYILIVENTSYMEEKVAVSLIIVEAIHCIAYAMRFIIGEN